MATLSSRQNVIELCDKVYFQVTDTDTLTGVVIRINHDSGAMSVITEDGKTYNGQEYQCTLVEG